ncbi:MAG TPA: hypothetical protein VFM27_20100, partial [Acidimicrobiales bacterium]|nr:hypothetical protein [Acidimicrobiales bacterium]
GPQEPAIPDRAPLTRPVPHAGRVPPAPPLAPRPGVVPPDPGPPAPPWTSPLDNPPPVAEPPVWQAAPPERQPVAPRPSLGPDQGGITSGGLTRRVPGAQLPTTEPLLLRRPDGGAGDSGVNRVASGSGAPQRTYGPERTADDVYGFLTRFTAGVRRGLEEQPAERRRNGTH